MVSLYIIIVPISGKESLSFLNVESIYRIRFLSWNWGQVCYGYEVIDPYQWESGGPKSNIFHDKIRCKGRSLLKTMGWMIGKQFYVTETVLITLHSSFLTKALLQRDSCV